MKKLSNILEESVWGGMLDRGSGDAIKKEDLIKDLYDKITQDYGIGFINEDKIKYKDDHIHIPTFKILNMSSYASIEINSNYISFSSLNVDAYKTMKREINYIKNDLTNLYDKIKEKFSPEIKTLDGMQHWIDFFVYFEKDATYEKCKEFIDFIMNNITNKNPKILLLLEKK